MGKPRRVGKYELKETLGRGNFSKVKRGIHIETKEVVAVKIVNIQNLEKQGMERQVKREISVLKSMKHINVVQMKEVLKSTNHIYIVMELITGGELFDKIVAAKKFEEDTARRYFRQLIEGISYCHQNNIAHRDLKPENLLLDASDNLKISDFGLSGIVNSNSLLQTICGTPHYVAPEVLTGKYEGKKADIWSCGIILFVMLSGCHPFDGETVNDLFKRIENLEFKYPQYFSSEARALLDKIIIVDPECRATIEDIRTDEWYTHGMDDSELALVTRKGSIITIEDEAEFNRNADIIITKEDVENAVQVINENEQSDAVINVKSATDLQDALLSQQQGKRERRERKPRTLNIYQQDNARMSVRMQNTEKITAFDIVAILVSNTLQNLISPLDKKEKKKALSKNNNTSEVKRNCTFLTAGHPDDIFDQISKFIQEIKHCQIKLSDTSYELKAKVRSDMEFGFKMSVLQTFGTNLCEMYRIKGDTLKFHELYRTIREKFGAQENAIPPSDVSTTPPPATTDQNVSEQQQEEEQPQTQITVTMEE